MTPKQRQQIYDAAETLMDVPMHKRSREVVGDVICGLRELAGSADATAETMNEFSLSAGNVEESNDVR